MSSDRLRLLIVDDHFAVRKGLAASIGTQPDLVAVAEAGTAAQALEAYARHHPDVVLMDLRLPDLTGQQAIAALCQRHPEARIVVFSSYSTEEDIYTAVQAGARGFLSKTDSWEDLATAIREVHVGRRYFPREISARLAERMGHPPLSEREHEVLQWVARGLSNKEIAERLGVTEMTIKIHLHHIFQKLPAKDRTHAVSVAAQRGLLRLE